MGKKTSVRRKIEDLSDSMTPQELEPVNYDGYPTEKNGKEKVGANYDAYRKPRAPVPSFTNYLNANLTPHNTPEEVAFDYLAEYGTKGDSRESVMEIVKKSKADNGTKHDYMGDAKPGQNGNGNHKEKDDEKEEKWYQSLGRKIKEALRLK
jgi:hypothetical protein